MAAISAHTMVAISWFVTGSVCGIRPASTLIYARKAAVFAAPETDAWPNRNRFGHALIQFAVRLRCTAGAAGRAARRREFVGVSPVRPAPVVPVLPAQPDLTIEALAGESVIDTEYR
ncbi:hypothetical protein AB0F85_11095, partial [Nocardia fluminea]